MAKRVENKVVLVTGAAGGLGRALALGFAREGARLILADLKAEGLAGTKKLIEQEGGQASVHRVDLSVESDIHAFANDVLAAHDSIDVLINNAGLAYGEIASSFVELSMEKWQRFLAINAIAPLLLAQALRPALAKAKGLVINQSSMASHVPATAYGVTKATLNAMTFGMASAFKSDAIRVNAIAPGIMETEASRSELSPETYARIQSMQLSPLHGRAEDIAAAAIFLASDDGRFMNCELLNVDGGNMMRGWRM